MVKVTIELENGTKEVFERECVLVVGGTRKDFDKIETDKAIVGEASESTRCSMLMSLMESVIDTTNDSFSREFSVIRLKWWVQEKEASMKKGCTDQKSSSEQIRQWLRKVLNKEGDNSGKE